MNSGKLILLFIAIGMIVLVLWLGYKLDEYEEKRKRKEKNTKKHNDDEFENSYNDFNPLRSNYESEINQTSTFANNSFNLKKVTEKSSKYSEELDKTAVIESVDLSKLENTEESKFYENLYEEPEIEEDIDDETYDYGDTNSSTMVFDTIVINNHLESIADIKGYKFDEDDAKETKKETKSKEKTTVKSTVRKTTNKVTKSTKTNTKK